MQEIILKCTPLRFYAQNDENAFFEWLQKIACIYEFKGIGRELHLSIASPQISFNELQDLLGIFRRYKFKNIQQLEVFKNEHNRGLFE